MAASLYRVQTALSVTCLSQAREGELPISLDVPGTGFIGG